MKEIRKLNLALICGGRSSEREVSLAGAKEVENALDKNKYNIKRYDPASDLSKIIEDKDEIDVAFILLHGRYGEDGTIQGFLELLDIPYQGSGVLGSAIAMDKHLSKTLYKTAGVLTPKWLLLDKTTKPNPTEIIAEIGLPLMVKPYMQGSSVGMSKVCDETKLLEAIDLAWQYDDKIIIEAFIKGRELTGGVIGLKELRALPIVEIIPSDQYEFFDYEAKYKPGATKEICPAQISEEFTQKAQKISILCHKALSLTGYSRTDMILSPEGGIYAIETNTIPGMTPTSLLPQAAQKAGISFAKLLDLLIEMALEVKGRYELLDMLKSLE